MIKPFILVLVLLQPDETGRKFIDSPLWRFETMAICLESVKLMNANRTEKAPYMACWDERVAR